jgi:hypothetical protein
MSILRVCEISYVGMKKNENVWIEKHMISRSNMPEFPALRKTST